ncbi:type II toxin-antitoxin system PemK/MazF family toxin [Bacillus sp. 123MFChir2]|uniref:type II toxin-antitoxin system PemK/MazF family toxin n=1 Tax=Bacillus sp. 123MFChir2 TaxID=1169144 RepID=UPI00037E59B2|nr:type II toxin-antitoxin system PemK/MazF family toxin [Bacillus sp. 123MFChir2]
MALKSKKDIEEFHKRTSKKLRDIETKKEDDPAFTIPRLKEDSQCVIDVKELLDELFSNIITYKQDYGLKWMKGLENYIEDKKFIKTYANHIRGNIVSVELFGHYGSELTFEHPAVILHDNKNLMLIAPVSTPKHGDQDELHIDVGESHGFKHECAVLLDSIRVIDKRRIRKVYEKDNINSNVGKDKLDEIDSVLLKHYLPKVYAEHIELKANLKEKLEQNSTLSADLEKTKNDLENQRALYEQAKKDLEDLYKRLQEQEQLQKIK